MKKITNIKKLILFFLMILVITLPCTSGFSEDSNPADGNTDSTAGNTAGDDSQQSAKAGEFSKGLEKVAENSAFILMADTSDGQIALKNKVDGKVWYSNPRGAADDPLAMGVSKMELQSQLILSVIEKANKDDKTGRNVTGKNVNSYVGCIMRKSLKSEKTKDGIRFIYDFKRPTEQFKISVVYRLLDDSLKVEVPISEISEYGDMSILSISLLPFFGAGSEKDNGYLMVPDGSGALINFNNGKSGFEQYSEDIYGRDASFEKSYERTEKETVHLPVYGIKNGADALMAVVENGDFAGRVEASVGGGKKSYNNIYCTFNLRNLGYITINRADWSTSEVTRISDMDRYVKSYAVRFFPLEGSEADYSGMAKCYRNYLMKEKGVKKITESKSLPFYAELYGSIKKKKSILGIPFNIIQPLTTYAQSVDILAGIKKAGVDDIVLRYMGWMKGGMEDKAPARVSPEGKLGGRSALAALKGYAAKNNIGLYPNAEFQNIYKSGNGYFKTKFASENISLSPATQFTYMLSTHAANQDAPHWYLFSPSLLDRLINEFSRSYAGYGISGLSAGSLGSLVYSDFRESRYISREAAGAILVKELAALKKYNGGLLLEAANAYALPYAGYIVDAPSGSSGFDIEDEEIPFYQMVIHGLIPYSSSPINLSSNVDREMLKCIDMGSGPNYAWIAGGLSELKGTDFDFLFSANYKIWLEKAVKEYKKQKAACGSLADKVIISRRKLQEGVFETVYENNARVIVNYNSEACNVDGEKIEGGSYTVTNGGE